MNVAMVNTNRMKPPIQMCREIRLEDEWLEIIEGSLEIVNVLTDPWWSFQVPGIPAKTAVPFDALQAFRYAESDLPSIAETYKTEAE